MKSCYRIARDFVLGSLLSSSSTGDPFSPLRKALWNAKVLVKVSICAWRACLDLLPTRAKLSSKGYIGDLRCILCSQPFEHIGHLICECHTAQSILAAFPFSLQVQVSNYFIFKEWMLDQVISLPSTVFARLLMIIWSL